MISTESIQSDEALIEEYLNSQCRECFDSLYDRYVNKVYAKSISLLQDATLAEDATHEIFMKVLLSLSKFKGSSKFSTWLYSITYNYCIDYIRKRTRAQVVSTELEVSEEPIEEVSDKELMEMRLDRLEVVMDMADTADRAILMMKYIDNMSIRDMAEALDKSESAIKMNIMRAKHRIRKLYQECYGE